MGVKAVSSTKPGQMGSSLAIFRFLVLGACILGVWAASVPESVDGDDEFENLENLIRKFEVGDEDFGNRVKRGAGDKGVTNLDIRDALLQMLKTMRDNNKRVQKDSFQQKKKLDDVTETLKSMTGSSGVEKKIDNISTFLLRMNNKIDSLSRGGGGGRTAILETLAQESYDIISLLPTYIDNTRKAIYYVGNDTKTMFKDVESLLGDDDEVAGKKSLRKELEDEIKGLANVEKVLLDTADSVMDTKRKIEFGVQQTIFKVSELIELSGGQMDDNLAAKFESITRTILSNQTEALTELSSKVEKDIGRVWRQMGIMYGQLSNSIGILEKVKSQTEEFTDKSNKNLGSMDNQVEGLTDRMTEVDDNLNYMLGQLSLVVSEFNQVKTGLGEAMEGIGEDLLEEYKKKDAK